MAQCKAENSKGEPCGAHSGRESLYCFMHDPAKGAERAEARKRGGLRLRPRHSDNGVYLPARVRTLEDLLRLLDYTLAEALPLENSVQRGRLLVAITGAFMDAIKTGELEARILVIENALEARGGEK